MTAIGMVEGLVAPASAAVTLDSSGLEVVADVVESDLSALAVGQTAIVSIDALGLDAPARSPSSRRRPTRRAAS